jgi:hypothetical protein
MLFGGREVNCGFTGKYTDGEAEVSGTALVGKPLSNLFGFLDVDGCCFVGFGLKQASCPARSRPWGWSQSARLGWNGC